MEENRRFRRIEASLSVEVERAKGAFTVRTQNLSAGGALLVSPVKPAPDEEWRVEIRVEPDDPPLPASARVVWARPHPDGGLWHAGIRFERMATKDRIVLRKRLRAYRLGLLAFTKEIHAFGDFTERDRMRLAAYCFRHDLAAGEIFYREGETGGSLFIIRHGTVRIYKSGSAREVTIATAGSGELFGEVSIVLRRPHGANVKAVVATELVGISAAAFDYLKWRNPRLALKLTDVLLRSLANRLGQTTRRLLSPIHLDELS